MSRKSNRRDFLRGKSAAAELGDLILAALPADRGESARGGPGADHYLLHVSRRAMACQFQVFLNAGQYAQGTQLALEVLDLVGALEEQLSFFRPSSQISRLNRTAAEGPVEVEPELLELLQLGLQLHAETGGAFDISSTPLWEVWGFLRRAGSIPSDDQLAEAMQYVGSHLVELKPQQKTVRFLKPGVRLNLGSMGKGYALDRCAEKLLAAGMEDFLIHGGQSSVLARGAQASAGVGSADGTPAGWLVGLRDPLRPDRRLGEIRLRNRALGTSGSQAQSFWHQGRRYGHILDPRTGRPAESVLSATVVAPSAVLADALSTAFYVMQPEAVMEYCRLRPRIGAVLVCPTRRRGGFEIKSTGLSEEELVIFRPSAAC